MFDFLARQAFRARWLFIGLGVAVLVVGIVYGTGVADALKDTGTTSPSSESEREAREIAALFPKSRASLIVVASSPAMTVEQPAFRAEFQSVLGSIARDSSRPAIASFYATHDPALVSHDHRKTFATISIPGSDEQQQAAYERIMLTRPHPADLAVSVGGEVVGDLEANAEVPKDLARAGLVSLPILAVLLVIVFRSLIAALLPLLIGAVAVLGAFALTRAATHLVDISVYAQNIIGLLGLGLAIDYSLLLVSRFRDELAAEQGDVPHALATSIKTAGESIFLSGSTVALSLLGLLIFPEPFLRSMGIGGSLAVVTAMTASLTMLPALLGVIGPWVNRLSIPVPHPKAGGQPIWRAFGGFVVRHAATILIASLAVLLAAGVPFLSVRFADPGARNLPHSFTVRQVAETVTRDFPAGADPPIEILVDLPRRATAPDQLANLSYFAAQIQATPGVRKVTSLVTLDPRLGPTAYADFYRADSAKARKARRNLATGDVTLLTVKYAGGSQDRAAQSIVRQIRQLQPPAGAQVLVGGDTASLVDRLNSLRNYLPVAATAIMVATFLLLRAMLGSVVIPLKAIVLNTLSLSAAFGLMTWIFQDGHLHQLLRFSPTDSLDPTLPVLIFAIAFGLATDYEVFLVSRIKEEYDKDGDNARAVVAGVEKTGGIVTSAGLLLIVVVAGFATSVIVSMKEMGVGLTLAVAVDAAIVRTLLVPAAMELLGRYNWWLPGKEV